MHFNLVIFNFAPHMYCTWRNFRLSPSLLRLYSRRTVGALTTESKLAHKEG
jgi:hypothetical protein